MANPPAAGTTPAAQSAQGDAPSTAALPLEGRLETSGLEPLAAWVSTLAVAECATRIALALKGKIASGEKLVVVDTAQPLVDDLGLIDLQVRFGHFNTAFDHQTAVNNALLNPARVRSVPAPNTFHTFALPAVGSALAATAAFNPTTALAAAVAGLPQAAELLGFFRSDTTVTGVKLDPSGRSLRWAVAGALAETHDVVLLELSSLTESEVIKAYAGTLERRRQLETSGEQLGTRMKPLTARVQALNASLESAKSQSLADKQTELEQALAAIHAEIQPLSDAFDATRVLLANFAAYQSQITTPAQGQSSTPLAQAAIRHHLKKVDAKYVLSLEMGPGAGESIAQRSLWPWMSVLHFVGAVSGEYALVRVQDNKVKAAGLVTAHSTMSQYPDDAALIVQSEGSGSGGIGNNRAGLIGLGVLLGLLPGAVNAWFPQLVLTLPAWVSGLVYLAATVLIVTALLWRTRFKNT